jgi:hypothetical protein
LGKWHHDDGAFAIFVRFIVFCGDAVDGTHGRMMIGI